MSLEKRSLLITIEFFYSRAEILPADQKKWFNSSIEEYKQYPVKRLKQWIANTKKLFKINKKNPTYGFNKITNYFSKIRETTEKKTNISNKSSEIFPLPNNSLAENPVDNNIQKNNVDYSQKNNLPNIQSELQDISENESNNINMSIPEYFSYSTITSSSKNSDTLINTKQVHQTKSKQKFDSIPILFLINYYVTICEEQQLQKQQKYNTTQ